ncbi:glutathione S-transferase, N-terminal domain protein [Bacteriovorax sp. BSW11_IV]|uniref:glutathione S-transferase family protein n=1 Tax=Bacteriovorax sp. BSW11_IV TaxID=1353529 RepID=UPI00038A5208|nr:glutathione S-transferase family protein [Bacteriovorax sp. BSW11_IV]EQC42977.1 glutathione S-transferase, N-terminal domain protein [Bacteriovorax sp. BSW11_IV]
MKLYGSIPSPFVRRNRIFLEDIDYEFVAMNIYEKDQREQLSALGPIKQIPILVDGQTTVYDSRIIFRYLNDKYKKENLTIHDENIITMIDACNDAQVFLLMLVRSDIDISQDKLFINNQKNRIVDTLAELDKLASGNEFDQWNFKAICLYSLLDWMEFRELQDLTGYKNLKQFLVNNKDREFVVKTDPRNS